MQIKTIFLTTFGYIFLGLGAIGLVLPILPTTPFVILSAACFSGTPHIRAKVMKLKFFREHIENYEKRTGLAKKTVIISLSYLWGMLIISMLVMKRPLLTLLLIVIGICVTTHILWVARPKDKNKER